MILVIMGAAFVVLIVIASFAVNRRGPRVDADGRIDNGAGGGSADNTHYVSDSWGDGGGHGGGDGGH